MDPFRDDRIAMQARAAELEAELEEARSELVRASAPLEALAKALQVDEVERAEEAEEIAALEKRLAALRSDLDRTRQELMDLAVKDAAKHG